MAVPFASAIQNLIDDQTAAVMRTIGYTAPGLRLMKIKPIAGLQLSRSIDATTPTLPYVGINQVLVAADYVHGTTRAARDRVSRLALPIRVDIDTGDLPSEFENEKKKQTRLGAQALGMKYQEDFFLAQGGLSDLNAPIGVYQRMQDDIDAGYMATTQRVNCNGPLTLEKVAELLNTVPERPGCKRVLFMNKKMRTDFDMLLHDPSYRGIRTITQAQDEFGMEIEKYGSVQIVVLERYHDGASPLSFTETTTGRPTLGTGTTATGSIWLISFGDEENVYGFAKGTIINGNLTFDRGDMGLSLEPFVRATGQYYEESASRWLFGFACDGPRWGGRLHTIDYVA